MTTRETTTSQRPRRKNLKIKKQISAWIISNNETLIKDRRLESTLFDPMNDCAERMAAATVKCNGTNFVNVSRELQDLVFLCPKIKCLQGKGVKQRRHQGIFSSKGPDVYPSDKNAFTK